MDGIAIILLLMLAMSAVVSTTLQRIITKKICDLRKVKYVEGYDVTLSGKYYPVLIVYKDSCLVYYRTYNIIAESKLIWIDAIPDTFIRKEDIPNNKQ